LMLWGEFLNKRANQEQLLKRLETGVI